MSEVLVSWVQRCKGVAGWLHGNSTQLAKRAMLYLEIVPPPFRVGIELTDRCNFRCPTCSKWGVSQEGHGPQGRHLARELGLEEWRVVLAKIRQVSLMREIAISGGEPFVRQDICQIVAAAKDQGLRVMLISNGWFVDREALLRLEEAGLDCLMVSLNSLKAPVHDASRGMPGSHRRIMDLIETWCHGSHGVDLALSTIVMESNCRELVALVRFARERGLGGVSFQVLLPTEVHYAFAGGAGMAEWPADWWRDSPLWVRSVDALRHQVKELLALKRRGYTILNPPLQLQRFPVYYEDPESSQGSPCLGPLHRMQVDPYGDVRLCFGYPPIGNLLHREARQLWWGEAAGQIRRSSRTCTKPCRMMNCNL